MTKIPDRISYAPSDKELYKTLREEVDYFSDKDNKDLFLFACSIGVKYQNKETLNNREGFFLITSLKDDDWALIKTLAISLNSIEILNNLSAVCEIAEEYAHAGIKKVIAMISESKSMSISFEKYFENDLFKFNNPLFEDSQ